MRVDEANTCVCGLGWVDVVGIDKVNGIDCVVLLSGWNIGIGLFWNVKMGCSGREELGI